MLAQKYMSGDTAVKIAASVETAIARGNLGSGERLPVVRDAAAMLGVSPATVAAAYRAMQQRGVIVSDGRRGTRVRPAAPVSAPPPPPLASGIRDRASGNPDLDLLPKAFDQRPYRDELNDPRLLDAARTQFEKDAVPAAHLAIVSGALDGVERVLREHLRPGDRVAVEDPCFTGVLDLLASLALVPVPVPVDDEGLLPEPLRRALKPAQALIVTPRAQNPTGAAITPKRARALRNVLAAFPQTLVMEDDHAGPVAGAPYITLVQGRERWAVVRSLSKSLGPDLRVALLAGDASTIARVEGRQSLGIRWVSHILQRIAADLLQGRSTQRLLARAEKTYRERRETLLRELAKRGIAAHGVSGLNVWIPVAHESAVAQSLLGRGWAVNAGERYRIASGPAIRVTIAKLEARDAVRFADDLASVLRGSTTRSA
ncbi:MAG TPA: aminotransferase class I/II-fold pyridoxal phosphate-dependent enzyme [Thermoanaerobaculia bacterium]